MSAFLRTALYPSVFAKVTRYALPFVNSYPDVPPRGYARDPDSLVLTSYLTIETSFVNVTLTPWDAPPTSVSSAAVKLLPPTFCASATQPPAPVPASVLNNNILNPLYKITPNNAQQLPILISTVVSFIDGSRTPALYFPPLIMQFSNASIAALHQTNSNSSNMTFRNDVVWAGPSVPYGLNYQGNPTPSVTLDLADLQGIIGLTGLDTGLFLQRLTLKNPVEAEGTARSGRTALPLWAFHFNR